jgi:hypothetical protein
MRHPLFELLQIMQQLKSLRCEKIAHFFHCLVLAGALDAHHWAQWYFTTLSGIASYLKCFDHFMPK